MASQALLDELGLPRDASQAEIRAAYLRLAKLYHPDVNRDPVSARNAHSTWTTTR